MNKKILMQIKSPMDIKGFEINDLESLAQEIRAEIISTVSKTGGHLAPSLGVVELTLALLKVFDFNKDKIVWDVGHQSYAYKILTRGVEKFHTLRQYGGISGFPKLSESPYDFFGVGHSSTSISAALGMAVARDLKKLDHKVIAVIGDGSMTAGLAYEGLNQSGDLEKDLIVILNDNEMSISKNVGALSSFLSRKLADRRFIKFKQDFKRWMKQIPKIGEDLLNYAKRSEESLKSLFTPGILFEAFKFNYVGPIDGHNISKLIKVFQEIKQVNRPILVHVLTKKGKGYPPAEKDPTHFHGVGKLIKSDNKDRPKKLSYSEVFGQTLTKLAEQNDSIIAVTAAMPEGTGLNLFRERFPDRFFDVGICEQHAVTFAAGLAKEGFIPVVAIYSTFLQRAYDQIIHDVCLQDLKVIFCMDRAGLVGEDGPTHHGSFDISYLRHIPNITIMAPKDEIELQDMLYTSLHLKGPVAIRYPRGKGVGLPLKQEFNLIPIGKGEVVLQGKDCLVIAIGWPVTVSLHAAKEIKEEFGKSVCVFNARFAKPIDKDILGLIKQYSKILIIEENSIIGGFSSGILEAIIDNNISLSGKKIIRMGIPDRFIEHGPQSKLRSICGLDISGIKKELKKLVLSDQ